MFNSLTVKIKKNQFLAHIWYEYSQNWNGFGTNPAKICTKWAHPYILTNLVQFYTKTIYWAGYQNTIILIANK